MYKTIANRQFGLFTSTYHTTHNTHHTTHPKMDISASSAASSSATSAAAINDVDSNNDGASEEEVSGNLVV